MSQDRKGDIRDRRREGSPDRQLGGPSRGASKEKHREEGDRRKEEAGDKKGERSVDRKREEKRRDERGRGTSDRQKAGSVEKPMEASPNRMREKSHDKKWEESPERLAGDRETEKVKGEVEDRGKRDTEREERSSQGRDRTSRDKGDPTPVSLISFLENRKCYFEPSFYVKCKGHSRYFN